MSRQNSVEKSVLYGYNFFLLTFDGHIFPDGAANFHVISLSICNNHIIKHCCCCCYQHLNWKCVVINISNEHERKLDSTKTMLKSEAKENALSIEIVLRYISNNTLFMVGKVFIQFIMNVQKEKVQHIYFSLELNQVFNFRKKVFLMTSWIFDVEMFRNKLKV